MVATAKPFSADRTEHGRYDTALARELLAMTSEFPDTRGGMLILLSEYETTNDGHHRTCGEAQAYS